MDTPVSKKPKKSMYYKMMRKAGMKKKMETDPTQWAQETPGPAKSSARSMENGDVVRRTGHGGGVASDGLVAAVQPARRRDGENRKAAIAKTTKALTGIVLAALVAGEISSINAQASDFSSLPTPRARASDPDVDNARCFELCAILRAGVDARTRIGALELRSSARAALAATKLSLALWARGFSPATNAKTLRLRVECA